MAMAGNSSNTVGSSSSPTKSMEEVWSDIKLSSLCDYSITRYASAFRPFLPHDFFSSDSLSRTLPANPALHHSSFRITNNNKRTRHDIHASVDRRHKRLIKNRDSSARSRARKQAYTSELERELAGLREENARLRRQQEKLCPTSLDRHLKKRTLLRTSTAPF